MNDGGRVWASGCDFSGEHDMNRHMHCLEVVSEVHGMCLIAELESAEGDTTDRGRRRIGPHVGRVWRKHQ